MYIDNVCTYIYICIYICISIIIHYEYTTYVHTMYIYVHTICIYVHNMAYVTTYTTTYVHTTYTTTYVHTTYTTTYVHTTYIVCSYISHATKKICDT